MLELRLLLPVLVALPMSVLPLAAQHGTPPPDGAELFQLVCAMCHSIDPPALLAPPMSHAAGYYLRAHGEGGAAELAMVAFLKDPAAERSLLPAHAVERFGLMPAQGHLSDTQLLAVVRYALSLADPTHGHDRPHGGGGAGGHPPSGRGHH